MLNSSVGESAGQHRVLSYFIISSIFLYFVFSPAINIYYFSGDAFRYTFGGFDKSCSTDDGFYFMMTLGRPIQAYLDCFSYKFATSVERMAIMRVISLFLLAGVIALFADWLNRLRFSFWTAFFIAGSIVVVPRLYDDTIRTAATALPLSVIIALLAYRLVNGAHSYLVRSRYWISGCCYLFGIIALLIALVTYPATTFFFVSLALSKVLFRSLKEWSVTRREVCIEVLVFVVACGIYFIGAYMNMHYNPQAPVPDAYQLDHPNLDIREIISRVFVLGNVFSKVWELMPAADDIKQGIIILCILTQGLIAACLTLSERGKSIGSRSMIRQAIFFTVTLFFIGSSFFFVIPTRDVGSRLLFGSISAGMLILVWCVCRIVDFAPESKRSMIMMCLLGSYFLLECHYADNYLLGQSLDSQSRMNFVKNIFVDYRVKQGNFKRVHFILRRPDYPYNRFFLANGVLVDVLGRGNYEVKWCSLERGVPGEEKDHQQEMQACLSQLPAGTIGVTYSYLGEPYAETEKMVIINNENGQI